jgi:hypothetical protein
MHRNAALRPNVSRWLLIAAMSAALAACSASAAAAPSARPTTNPTPSPTSPAAATTAPATPLPSGPVDYAEWVARQGFGGSSGLRQLVNDVTWIQSNPTQATLFDIDDGLKRADRLRTWLDDHEPTACWADYHVTVRAALGRIVDGLTAVHDAKAAGKLVPSEIAAQLVTETQAAWQLAAPAC